MNQETVRFRGRISRHVLLAAAALVTQSACLPLSGTDFRNQALPAIETGVGSILDGLVSGVFAAIQTEPTAGDQDATP